MLRFVSLAAGLILISRPAYAYIDPGILGVLYQAAYALVFGAFVAIVIRPWQYIKGAFARLTGRKQASPSDDAKRAAVGDRDVR
jgi:hypothetical protein